MGESSIKILTGEADAGLAEFIQQTLSMEGYSSFMATDGQAAVDFFKENRPDIILIDIALGEDSIYGLEVLRRIKIIDEKAICIMSTRVTDEHAVLLARDLGALHYILKPLRRDDILRVVDEAAEIIRQRRTGHGI
ncbi:MAG: response regulator [Candidatus Omnitrophica bacterium]|nr:response regulator [Candidatus Omnitrophota bacterium]